MKIKNAGKWLIISLLTLCVALAGCFSGNKSSSNKSINNNTPGTVVNEGGTEFISNQILVKFKTGADMDTILKSVKGRIIKQNQSLGYYLIGFEASNRLNSAVAKRILRDSKQVEWAEANYIYKANFIPNDPDLTKQWGLEKIDADTGWDYSTGSDLIKIAIVDTGIDHNHPDLAGKVVDGYNIISDFPGLPGDDAGHGTHCAGIAAALSNNGVGVAGVAWQCKLLAVKVLDNYGSGYVYDVASGIQWAADNGADVISLSLGGSGYSRMLEDAVDYALNKNVVVVAAAGNDYRLNDWQFPAGYPGVIAVGASSGNNTKAGFSTESNHLFITAPGEKIYSTLPNNSYAYLSGTSMATPFVSGAVALIKSRFGKDLSLTQVQSQLKQTATDLGAFGWDQQTGWGLVNLPGALSYLQINDFGTLILTVDDGNGNPLPDAEVLLKDNSGRTIYNILTGPDGKACFWSLPAGSYSVYADKSGYQASGAALVTECVTVMQTLSLPFPAPVFPLYETAENSPSCVTTDGIWGTTGDQSYSAPYCWTDSPGGDYDFNTNASLITVPVNLSVATNPILSFHHKYNVEEDYDYCHIEISTDSGGSWNPLQTFTGTMSSWEKVTVDLSGYNTESNVLIRFRLTSDYLYNFDGWYVDEIKIDEGPPLLFSENGENNPANVVPEGPWGITNSTSYSAPYCWTDSAGGNYNDGIDMSLTTVSINLLGTSNPVLSFQHKYEVEPSCDFCWVEISTDGGSVWTNLASYNGYLYSWSKMSINLAEYKTYENVLIRFRLTTDSSVIYDGWYIDDIQVADI